MPFCGNCGREVHVEAIICPGCGVATKNITTKNQPIDNGGFGWGLLGFCIPIVGLILYLVWKTERPITAKSVGLGALISVVINAVIFVIYFILIVIAFSIY